jgi:hypothetical protein
MFCEAQTMLFLLNDVIFRPDTESVGKAEQGGDVSKLGYAKIEWAIMHMFAQTPSLAKTRPETALKVIDLLVRKHPELNAAWFRAPHSGCDPSLVRMRYANVGFEVLASLYARQERGVLTTAIVDYYVWQQVPMRRVVTRA